jgi:hypothetical protein
MTHKSAGGAAAKTPVRIALQMKESVWNYRPLDLPTAALQPLPRIPVSMVYQYGDWLRCIWHHYRRVACVLFLWDPHARRWHADVPPQTVSENSFRCDLTFAGFPAPHVGHLLCGSLSTNSSENGDEIWDGVPPFDGIHIIQHSRHELVTTSTFARAHGSVFDVSDRDLLDAPHQPEWAEWTRRIRLHELMD